MDISSADNEPLTPAVFHVLLSLAGGVRHGYGVMQDVLTDTGGKLRLGPGTLYGTLKRLLTSGWVTETDAPTEDAAENVGKMEERRRYYRLTEAGRRALNAEAQRLERAVRVIQTRRVLMGEAGNS